MRWLPVLVVALAAGAAAGALLPSAMPPEPAEAPRGRLANPGLDHADQSDPPPELQPAPEARPEVQVELRGRAFEPGWLSIPQGTTVTFWNRDLEGHTATVRRAGGAVLLDAPLEPGREASLRLDAPGAYEVRCRYHSPGFGGAGMVATLQAG